MSGRSNHSQNADAPEEEWLIVGEVRATESTECPKTKSASSIRADVAEAELATLREEMNANKVGLYYLIRSEMELRVKEVAKDIQLKYAKASTLELVIVMDCTQSMSPWIDEAKTAIISIINNVKSEHPGATVWVGFVAYRDFSDGDKRLQIQTLTTDVAVVQTFISSLEAFGGDGPEDIPGGLAAALEMPFQAEAIRIVLVSDAPCHGTRFHDGHDDDAYRVQIEQSPDICAQMREMAKRGIDFTVIEIQLMYTTKMIAILQEEFDNAESHDEFGREFEIVSLENSGDAARFTSVIRSSASSSISVSRERSTVASSKAVVGVSGDYLSGGTCQPKTNLSHVLEGDEEEEKLGKMTFVVSPEVRSLGWSELDRLLLSPLSAIHFTFNTMSILTGKTWN